MYFLLVLNIPFPPLPPEILVCLYNSMKNKKENMSEETDINLKLKKKICI